MVRCGGGSAARSVGVMAKKKATPDAAIAVKARGLTKTYGSGDAAMRRWTTSTLTSLRGP